MDAHRASLAIVLLMDPSIAQAPVGKRVQPLEVPERPAPRRQPDEDYVDLRPYLLVLRERWRLIVAATAAAVTVTAVVAGVFFPKWYRATAVIRPISTPAVESRITGLIGGLGGGALGGGGLGGLAASLGGGGSSDAEEYIAILRGFQFNVTLSEHHHLSSELLRPSVLSVLKFWAGRDQRWKIYRTLEKQFGCDYSVKTGNITISFITRDRKDAERTLGYYIDDLRDLLRSREVIGALSAIESMKEEANSTPDSLLRAELYELVAKQVQRKKMAQVEADFAFRVLDPPAASDKPYQPNVPLDCSVIGFLTALAITSFVSLRCRPYEASTLHGPSRQPTEDGYTPRQSSKQAK